MNAYIEMITRNGSYAIAVVLGSNIVMYDDGYALEELPHYNNVEAFDGLANFYQMI